MLELFARIRFLPVTIFAASLMLTVKLGNIWDGFDGLRKADISVSDALAQQNNAAAPADPAMNAGAAPAPTDPNAPAAPMDAGNVGDSNAATEGLSAAEPEAPYQDDPAKVMADDPTLLTQSEIDLLQQLAERRGVIEKREKEMTLREGLLNAAETRIDDKIKELKGLQETINSLIDTYDAQQETKMQSLVKIYENMKPKDAAKIFEALEIDTLLLVVERMKERKLAPIMAKMNPDKARDITVELVRLREIPQPGSEIPQKGG